VTQGPGCGVGAEQLAELLPGLGGQHLLEGVDPGDEVGADAPFVDALHARLGPVRGKGTSHQA
jgi:hypothetical protein